MTRSRSGLASIALFAGLCLLVACANPVGLRSTSVRFETARSQILVPVQLGEGADPYWFILDSAVDPSVIDESLLDLDTVELISDEAQEAEGTGDGEGLAVRPARVHQYSIGGMELSRLEAVAADLSAFGNALGRPLAGILGYSFLKDKAVRIDYFNTHVDLAFNRRELPEPTVPPTEIHRVSLQFMTKTDLIPVFDLTVNGETVRVSLDTGSSLGLQIYSSAVERLGLETLRDHAERSSITGARGEAEIRKAILDGLVLGPFEEVGVPLDFSERTHDPAQRQGNVGNRFLERFVLTLDYVDHVMIFEQ